MQLIEDTTNEILQQQQQQQQQQQYKSEQQQPTTCVSTEKMHKFYPPKPKINAFNDLFTCSLCQGYMINPTAIDVCLHTYCRSCIVRHLAADSYCPQCKLSGGKAVTTANLKSDDILRSIIYKLVPGLYQKECQRLQQFVQNAKNEENASSNSTSSSSCSSNEQSLNELLSTDEEGFFSPTEPISLSLEFHPVLAEQCPDGLVPAVCYLQCPASVKMQHLKRFLCSKFNIDPCNRRVGIDIIYEEEILPSDFTLMDVGYCYQWSRQAPLKLTYRILIYNEDMHVEKPVATKSVSSAQDNCYRSANNAEQQKLQTQDAKPTKCSHKLSSTAIKPLHQHSEVPVKVTISRKSAAEGKKTVSKKSSSSASTADEFVVPTTTTNDFKSLRSNDIRYSNYTITSSTPAATPTPLTTPTLNTNTTHSVPLVKKEKLVLKEEKLSKCDIVVSIPHNQMQEEWDSKPLSELKTASKKSPNAHAANEVNKTTVATVAAAAPPAAKKNRNVPKLKIELNSLKTKLIEKPKSADIRLDTLMLKQHHKPRKFSLDEPQPVADKVDLETYVKNIGLKPIEIHTPNYPETPNASPMSSSSSNTSSSNGNTNFNFNGSADCTSTSSSSHKKRKKKHSKDSRESKDSKRKKMHAEISSHSAEESLKMKVKLTPPINLKSLKFESKKSPPFGGSHETSGKTETSKEFKKSKSMDNSKYKQNLPDKLAPLEIKTNLTSLASGSKPLTKEFDDDEGDLTIPDSTSLTLNKSLNSIKETPLPQSPPLPPSLFKTTTLTFPPFTPNITTVAKSKPVAMPKDSKDKPKTTQVKLIAPKPIAPKILQPSTFKPSQFAVPNPPTPTRFMSTSNTSKFLSTPTSIASNLLKRSVSLDEHKHCAPGASLSKQSRLEKPNQITVSAYGSNLHMTKVEIPATPTSSTAKATYEIPLYSPLSASYNPKCSFSVNSSTVTAAVNKTSKVGQANSLSTQKPNRQTMDSKKCTASQQCSSSTSRSLSKPLSVTTTTSNSSSSTTTTTTASTTLMGPPKPMQKLNSLASLVPITMKSPPLSKAQTLTNSNITSVSAASTTNSNSIKTTAIAAAVVSTQQHKTAAAVLSTASLSMVNYKQSKVLLAHVKPPNLPDIKIETTNAASATTTTAASSNNPLSKPKTVTQVSTNGLAAEQKPKTSSLREFRLPSRESATDILDLSSAAKTSSNGLTEKPNTTINSTNPTPNLSSSSTSSSATSPSSTGSTLEMALNKIKQNMCSTTAPTTTSIANQHNIMSLHYTTSVDKTSKKPDLTTSSSLAPIADDLQNLHLLSESATAREKIAISTASITACSSSSSNSSSTTSTTTSPYEKVKITQNTLVRQQNASVRNIPNPSALAFRNQQPAVTLLPPMVTIAPGIANKLNDLDKPLLLKTPSPPKSPHSSSTSSSSSTSPSRTINKKHPSIDQVAASLNMRASAAAEASAKAHSKLSQDETSLVTSTSSLDGKQIKLETGEVAKQNEASSAALPSSTTSTVNASSSDRSLLNNHLPIEIKKEPDDRMDDSCDAKVMSFVNATTTTTTSTPSKSSVVENLVTSVINVTAAPTTKLLTTATSVGY